MAANSIEILRAGSVMVGVVADIYKQAKPVIDQIDTDEVMAAMKDVGDAAEGVLHPISREGDPDVYADVKYKQNVRVFVFNCMPDDLDEQLGYLRDTFEVELG